jgi:hypothetical protein
MKIDPIGAFLEEYAGRCAEHGLLEIPASQLRPVLETFVLAEPWLPEDPTGLAVAVRSLRRAVAGDKALAKLARLIERETTMLAARLERQISANVIIREHVIMLADKITQLERQSR